MNKLTAAHLVLIPVFALTFAAAVAASADVVPGQFTQTTDLAATRWGPAAIALTDGRVLLAGGIWIAGYGLRETEIFDPATATWTQTGDMIQPRYGHGITRLNDGRVMVVGGVAGYSVP
jgi:Kelch motif protein